MIMLLIVMGASLAAIVGCAFLSPDEERERLMEDIAQSFF